MKLGYLMLLMVVCFSLPLLVSGQVFRGRLTDAASRKGVADASVRNMSIDSVVYSDSSGHFAIRAAHGDNILIQHSGYKPVQLIMSSIMESRHIELFRSSIELKEVVVSTEMAKFKRDSAFNHQFFHKDLGYAGSQIHMSSSGIGADGLFSELALRVSGKKKKYQEFANLMESMEEDRYKEIRYSPALVRRVTGLNDSLATQFIVQHPIPYDFLRSASDLDIKIWILERYKGLSKTTH
jgi:hypothetical protein